MPLEAAWDQRASTELRAEASSLIWSDGAQLTSRLQDEPCLCPWELLVDGSGPPARLRTAMARGATIFKQSSPYSEFFYELLTPWVHYVPVADNLADLGRRVHWADMHPAKVRAMGELGHSWADREWELADGCPTTW